jgi:hypothetical protein
LNVRRKGLIVLLMLVLFIFMGASSATSTTKHVNLTDKKFTTVTIPFTENNGQVKDKSVKYIAKTLVGNVYVKDNGIVYTLSKDKKTWIVAENFVNANDVSAKGIIPSKTKINYYKGNNPKNWQKNLSTYQQILYSNLYTGIDLRLKAHGKNIEKIYTIGSTGSPDSIWISVTGSKGLKINKKGELEILNGLSALKLTKPVAYQIINGKRVNISVSYVVKGSSYGYKTGTYNNKYKLIIDPLLSSTFLGGNSYDGANGIAVDKAGYVYVTGYTGSNDFPTTKGQQFNVDQSTGEWDAFVSKFSNDLSTLIESTYIGGTYSDQAKGIALDYSGNSGCNVFITGVTYSTGRGSNNDFPTGVVPGLNMTWETGAGDVFVTKLDNNLGLIRSSIIGGNRADVANGIIVDASNNIYITGQTFSYKGTDPSGNDVTSYPVRYSAFGEPTMQNTYVGNGDIFVSKLNNYLSAFTSGVVFGGSGTSYANGIATDQQNYIYITGATNAPNFPALNLTNVYPNNGLNSLKGDYDAFVMKLSCQQLENVEALALLGGSARDIGNGIAIDQVGRVYVVGGTWSNNFKPMNADSTKHSPNTTNEDAFITILNKELQNVLYSVYLGGNGDDVANGVVLSFLGQNIGVVGTTNSTDNTFPKLSSERPPYYTFEDVFLVGFKNFWSQRDYDTTILGGANADYGMAAAMDTYGNVYLAGNTWSNDYPTTIGAFSSVKNDNLQYVKDAYVSVIDNLVDTEPPIITSTDPVNYAINVALNKVIKIVYNEQIQPGNDFGSITLTRGGVNVPITTSIAGNTLIVSPLTKYLWETNYLLSIPLDAIKDLSGNIADEYALNFKTAVPLKLVSTDPVNNAINVPVNKVIKITFNKPIKAGSQYNLIVLKNSANVKIPITKSISGNVLTITKTNGTFIGDTYTLTLPVNSILDANNTGLTAVYTTRFTVDSTPPVITSTDPANNAVKVATNKAIVVNFSKAIKIGPGAISIRSSNGTVIAITSYTITNNGRTLTLFHSSLFAKATKYTVLFQTGSITDLANNYLAAYSTSFITAT